jgi:hypothetical protein
MIAVCLTVVLPGMVKAPVAGRNGAAEHSHAVS